MVLGSHVFSRFVYWRPSCRYGPLRHYIRQNIPCKMTKKGREKLEKWRERMGKGFRSPNILTEIPSEKKGIGSKVIVTEST